MEFLDKLFSDLAADVGTSIAVYDIALIAGLGLCCCAGFLIGNHFSRRSRDLHEIVSRSDRRIAALIENMVTMEKKLDSLGRGQSRLLRAVEQIQLFSSKSDDGYTQAAALARRGASTEQLVERCGITRSEAELLRRLNAQQSRTQYTKSEPSP